MVTEWKFLKSISQIKKKKTKKKVIKKINDIWGMDGVDMDKISME